jgi:hypothetical protein
MGSWFVLSALGLFSTTPGTPDYVMNTPLFKHTVIHRGSDSDMSDTTNDFHIIAKGAETSSIHTSKVTLNGVEVTAPTISDYEIVGGSVLQFFLTSEDSSASPVSITEARATNDKNGNFEAKLQKQNEVISDLEKQLASLRKNPPAVPDSHGLAFPPRNNLEPQYVQLRRGKHILD